MENSCTDSPQRTQQAVGAIWSEILKCPASIAPDDEFFALGGDSLAVMMVTFRINEQFATDLEPEALMGSSCFGDFCSLVERARVKAE